MVFSRRKQLSVEVGPARPGEGAPRRNINVKDAPRVHPMNNPDIKTLYDLLQWAVKTRPDLLCQGWRTVVDVHEETKMVTKMVDGQKTEVEKKWKYFEMSPFHYLTTAQVGQVIRDYGAGLMHIGIKPNGVERFHIYAQTSAQWLQTALALNSHSVPAVTAYDTLGESGVTHSMLQTGTVGVFTDNAILHTLINPLKQATGIRVVVYRDPLTDPEHEAAVKQIKQVRPDIELYSYNDVVELGKEHPCEPHPPSADDVALIMYTSGSSGAPKGVVLTNGGVVAGVAGVSGNLINDIEPGDSVLAFLPLAHILEFTVEVACLGWGATLGYGTVRTLTDESVRNCLGDFREFKPSIFAAVPAVWESVRKGVLRKVSELPPLSQKVFWAAYHAKAKLATYGLPMPFVDNLIFKKIKAATGGRLKWAFCGGSSLSADTQTFLGHVLCPIVIGYGLTETNANLTVMSPSNYRPGIQGEPTYAVTVKLVDCLHYKGSEGQGEILVKGKPIMVSYFNNEDLTKEVFDDEGYFRTGDIGEWTDEGQLRIIDRKKNLVKTLNGEYVAIERLESVYRSNPFVDNICVYADETRYKPIAIIVPMEKTVEQYCKQNNLTFHEDVNQDPKIAKAIEASLLETAKSQGLRGTDLIQGVVISDLVWSPQNGYLTSAQKLQRTKILEHHQAAIDKLYGSSS